MKRLIFAIPLVVMSVAAPLVADDAYLLHSFKKLHLNDQFWSEGANVADINRDGKMDIVSGPYWYAGPEFTQKSEIYPPKQSFKLKKEDGTEVTVPGYEGALGKNNSYSDNFFCYTYDFNNDGWSDVMVYGLPGLTATWFENPKGEKKHWTPHVVLSVLDNESPMFADITGDGKPEIIGGTTEKVDGKDKGYVAYATADWSAPEKPWTFHKVSPAGPWQRFTHGLGVGDVNADGHQDILVHTGWFEQPVKGAGETEWKFHPVAFGGGGAQMHVYDVNADGLNDVITSLKAHEFGLSWFEQYHEKGEAKFREHLIMGSQPKENQFGLRFSQIHAIDLVDMDGDGLKDIVTGKRFWAHGAQGDPEPNAPAVLYWFKLVRKGDKSVEWIPQFIDDDSGVGTQVLATDVNGDGLPDIVVGNKKGTYVHIHEVTKVSKEQYQKVQPKIVNPTTAAK